MEALMGIRSYFKFRFPSYSKIECYRTSHKERPSKTYEFKLKASAERLPTMISKT